MLVLCTANALRIRTVPEVRDDTDTGRRMLANQLGQAYGKSLDGKWLFVVAPTGTGWLHSSYLEAVTQTPGPDVPRWAQPPHGIDAIRRTFGDIRQYINADGSLRDDWVREQITGKVVLPKPLQQSWSSLMQHHFPCHHLVQDPMQSAFEAVYDRGLWALMLDWGGCYNFRPVAGRRKLSTHAWGIAVDVNARANTVDPRVVAIFEDHGFHWGGRWSKPDPMHFQYATGY